MWGANSLFPSYYTAIWEARYDSEDLLGVDQEKDVSKGQANGSDAERGNILRSGAYTEEDVYSEENAKKRSFFVDKINEFSVNPISVQKNRSSFYANAGFARSFSSQQSRKSNQTAQNEALRNEELIQILEVGSNDGLSDQGLNGTVDSEKEKHNTVIKLQEGLTPQELAVAVESINGLVELDKADRNGSSEALTFEYVEAIPAISTKDDSCQGTSDLSYSKDEPIVENGERVDPLEKRQSSMGVLEDRQSSRSRFKERQSSRDLLDEDAEMRAHNMQEMPFIPVENESLLGEKEDLSPLLSDVVDIDEGFSKD